MAQILEKKKNIIYFKLYHIITESKPGVLIDLDLTKITSDLGIFFQYTKSFYITQLNSKLSRGNHSNNNCKELIFCLNGSFDIKLFDGEIYYNFNIKENEGIYVSNNIWIEINNFKNCIILVFVDVTTIKDSCYDFIEFKNKFIKEKS